MKVIGHLYTLSKRGSAKLHYLVIATNRDITIDPTCKIDVTAKVEIKHGGSISIKGHTEILEGVIIQSQGGHIKIGDHCSINPYTIIYGHGNTTIGNNVLIAGGCMIIPSNHAFDKMDVPINNQNNIKKGITIENNVWIGHGCSILDGVAIGEGSVIAAGSVVNKSVPPFSVVAGVPAVVIKRRK